MAKHLAVATLSVIVLDQAWEDLAKLDADSTPNSRGMSYHNECTMILRSIQRIERYMGLPANNVARHADWKRCTW